MTYLTWCYDHLYGLVIHSSSMNTILIHCSDHSLKNVISKSKKVKCSSKLRNTFIFSFSLLQNATKPEEFEATLINISSYIRRTMTKGAAVYYNFPVVGGA